MRAGGPVPDDGIRSPMTRGHPAGDRRPSSTKQSAASERLGRIWVDEYDTIDALALRPAAPAQSGASS